MRSCCGLVLIAITGLSRGILEEHLTIDDLEDILDDFFDAKEKWYFFGLHLRLKDRVLEPLRTSNGDSTEKFTAVLRELLNGNGCHPITRSHLVNALEAKTVGLRHLAKELRQKFSTTPAGDLYVNLNNV